MSKRCLNIEFLQLYRVLSKFYDLSIGNFNYIVSDSLCNWVQLFFVENVQREIFCIIRSSEFMSIIN